MTFDRSVVYTGSSTNKTDRHAITEILLRVALSTIKQTNILSVYAIILVFYVLVCLCVCVCVCVVVSGVFLFSFVCFVCLFLFIRLFGCLFLIDFFVCFPSFFLFFVFVLCLFYLGNQSNYSKTTNLHNSIRVYLIIFLEMKK